MMMAASKMCACGVRFRWTAPVVGPDTFCGWNGDDTGFRYGEWEHSTLSSL